MGKPRIKGKVRLAIDFDSAEALVGYVDRMHELGVFPEEADAFAMDYLDQRGEGEGGGITAGSTFIVRRAADRIRGTALRDLIGRSGR